MIAEIYVEVDDFCQNQVKKISSIIESTPYFKKLYQKRSLGKGMTMSEIMTILIYYHHSGYKNFKTYYHKEVLKY